LPVAILLFTDFGSNDLYVGQVEAVLDRHAPGVRVIHLLHESPPFNVRAAAHLLAALAHGLPRGQVFLGVVDPGVGTERGAVVLRADDRWYIGPDNGLFSVIAARASSTSVWRITVHPARTSPSFHGRDVFAPIAAAVATDDFPNGDVAPAADLAVRLGGDDLAEVIYVDHFGNAFTGIRARDMPAARRLVANGREIPHARVFAEAAPGTAFWYENSIGLVEIAVNQECAARALGLGVGTAVAWG
jgi:S-adenosyl-L-methionine hydrolase (adenosine-forming)